MTIIGSDMEREGISGVGTGLKLMLYMKPLGGHRLSEVDWSVRVHTQSRARYVDIAKEDAIKVDDDDYIIIVDTTKVGAGVYYLRLTAFFPDEDCPGGLRKEVVTIPTGECIGGV